MNHSRSQRPDFLKKRADSTNKWYDLYDDWDLIDASFAAQYGIRLRNEPEMSWGEFCTLLAGIMPETPLGQVVSIRSETNKDILKQFGPDQHRIRSEWRARLVEKTANSAPAIIANFQEACRQAFGSSRREGW